MDRELEILRTGSISVLGIFIISNYHESGHSYALFLNPMDSTIGAVSAKLSDQTFKNPHIQYPAGDINPTHIIILIDDGPQLNDGWHAVRKKPSLPVLCIHRLGDTLFVMEVWTTSGSYLYNLGSSRAGMERLSKHRPQLCIGGWLSGRPGLRRLVWNPPGLH